MAAIRAVGRTCVFLVLLVMTGLGSGCAVSQDQEVDMGREAAPQFVKEFGGLYPDPQVQQYVNQVGLRVAKYAGRPDLPWEFGVVNSKEVNAFALPGGYIYITRGMLAKLENEAQLASILAHEAAHVAHRHSVQQLERQQVIQGGATLAGLASGTGLVGDVSQIVGGLVLMKYSREQETEADLTGLDYLLHAGYDPHAMVRAMEIIGRSDGGGPPEFFSSHPSSENRIEDLSNRIQSRYANVISVGRTNAAEYQSAVLGRLR